MFPTSAHVLLLPLISSMVAPLIPLLIAPMLLVALLVSEALPILMVALPLRMTGRSLLPEVIRSTLMLASIVPLLMLLPWLKVVVRLPGSRVPKLWE